MLCCIAASPSAACLGSTHRRLDRDLATRAPFRPAG